MEAAVSGNRPSHADATRALLRDRVLDAVGNVLASRSWSEIAMAAIAREAGVSRQTLYNAFGSRDELAQAYVLREADRFALAVEDAVKTHDDDPRAALAAAVEIFLTAAGTHPLVRAITASEDGDELLPLVTTRGGPVVDDVTERLGTLIAATWDAVSIPDARLIADCLVRLAISHAALPSGTPQATAASIVRVLGPFIDSLLEVGTTTGQRVNS